MAKKRQKRIHKSTHPKIVFFTILILLFGVFGYLILNSISNNKVYINPNQDQNEYDYGGSNLTTDNYNSTYSFEEFGHGYSFTFPAAWDLREAPTVNSDNLLRMGNRATINFGYSSLNDTNDFIDSDSIVENLTIDGHPAVLRTSNHQMSYGFTSTLTVSGVQYGKRINSKEVIDVDAEFIMKLVDGEYNVEAGGNDKEYYDAKKIVLEKEFKKVYETLKFSDSSKP